MCCFVFFNVFWCFKKYVLVFFDVFWCFFEVQGCFLKLLFLGTVTSMAKPRFNMGG